MSAINYKDNAASRIFNIQTSSTNTISRVQNSISEINHQGKVSSDKVSDSFSTTTENVNTSMNDGEQVQLTTASTTKARSTPSSSSSCLGLDNNIKDLKILNHLKNIEKINEKRRFFLNTTVGNVNETPTLAQDLVVSGTLVEEGVSASKETNETINGDGIQSTDHTAKEQQQQLIHTIHEVREIEECEVNGFNKEDTKKAKNFSIKYATLPKQAGAAPTTTTTTTITSTTSPLKSPTTPPPKPPMLSRTRSIGPGDNRSSPVSPTTTAPSSPAPTPGPPPKPTSAPASIIENNASIDTSITNDNVQLRKHHQHIIGNEENASSSSPPPKDRPASTISSTLGQPISPKHYEALVEQLRCPGCANAMKAPILLCKSGHSICDQCTRILLMCPLCKETFTNNRSLTVEALCAKAHFRCSHAAGGCSVRMPIALLDWHEKQCVYKPMKCFMGRVWNDCQWYGREIQWKEHLETDHANKVFNTGSVNLIWNMGVKQKPLTGYYVFQVHDEMFNFYEIYDRERVLFTMTCTSSFKDKKYNFAYEVTLIHPNNDALAITQKFPVHSEYDNDILMDGTCVSITMTDLHKFIDDDKLLHYSVNVLVVKSPRKPFTTDSNVRKSFPLNYQQTQFECGNIKSVSSDLIITRKVVNNDRNSVPYADADGSTDTSPNKMTKMQAADSASGSENDTEFNMYIERNWGTPQLHFNRKYLKSSPNNSCSPDGDSHLDELGPLRAANMQIDDKVSLCSTNISYTKKVSNTLRKSFRALKTDLIEMKPFSKKSPEKNSGN